MREDLLVEALDHRAQLLYDAERRGRCVTHSLIDIDFKVLNMESDVEEL